MIKIPGQLLILAYSKEGYHLRKCYGIFKGEVAYGDFRFLVKKNVSFI